jgi:hypothetical protein
MQFHKTKPSFDKTVAEINRFKEHVQLLACPACTQKTLKVDKLEVSKLWTADISCTNCDFKGAVNTSGFSFIGVSSKGKAVKEAKNKATIPDRTLRR